MKLALLTEIPAPYRIPLFNALAERVELRVLFLAERDPRRAFYELHEDEWRFDPRSSFAYQDAYYGYDGRHLEQDEYQHYFREGFERGYEDGYYGRPRYGHYVGGKWTILGTVVGAILDLVSI